MLQVAQDNGHGKLELVEVPAPALLPSTVKVLTVASLISAGTERYMIDLAKKSLVGKARARPDLARQVIEKARKEGVVKTIRTVFDRLEKPMPLGYSAAGVVEQVGENVDGFKVGDRVAIAGAGYANHAEVNCVPTNLVALIPDGVDASAACYTTVASIAMQGVRIAKPEIGEYVVVIGLGLIGLITTQILVANGCRVIGVDPDPRKAKLALESGAIAVADSPAEAVRVATRVTGSRMADTVLVTAATTSSGPVELAGEVTRRKGKVVVVGVVGMDVPRESYYKKELELKLSMSYGPGRYDPQYEEGGVDYPYDYVRWTEQRNMESVLALMASGGLNTEILTTHRFSFDNALDAYKLITENAEPHTGVVLEYDVDRHQTQVVETGRLPKPRASDQLVVGFAGAGNYAASFLLPNLGGLDGVSLKGIATATGLNAEQKARKFGFAYCTTNFDQLVADDDVNTIFVATRHATHASFACRALDAGKHVFVEKPIAVSREQLHDIRTSYMKANADRATGLMVGLNRRFAPMVMAVKDGFSDRGPKQIVYRVNSGHIPKSSWLHDPAEGGGMMIGEMCHFVDLMRFLVDAAPVRVYASSMQLRNSEIEDSDNTVIVVSFEDGSVGSLNYNTVGSKAAPKERIEVFADGDMAVLDDFRTLTTYVSGRKKRERSSNQDKGQRNMLAATVEGFRRSGSAPIPFAELDEVMKVIFAARDGIASGNAVDLTQPDA